MARAIDVHTHFVPHTMPSAAGRNALWPSIEHKENNVAAVIVGGKVFRIIDSRSWDAERRLRDMQTDDVDVQVVSPMPELLSHWFPADDADILSNHINHAISELCARNPKSFIGIGMAPMQDPALAARRLADIKQARIVRHRDRYSHQRHGAGRCPPARILCRRRGSRSGDHDPSLAPGRHGTDGRAPRARCRGGLPARNGAGRDLAVDPRGD